MYSKWLNVLVLSLFTAGAGGLAVFDYQSEADYAARGKTAQVEELLSLHEETGPSGRGKEILATMTYLDVNGTTTTFKRFVSGRILADLTNKAPVPIEYIPGEWNSERFADEGSPLRWAWFAFVGFLAALVYVIRKPGQSAEQRHDEQQQVAVATPSAATVLVSWIFRAMLLLMAFGGLLGGGAGLIGEGANTLNLVLLAVGAAFSGLFWLSLRMRLG